MITDRRKVYLDFETKSLLDLPDVGSDVYAKHPSTDLLCLSFLEPCTMDKPVLVDRRKSSDKGNSYKLEELAVDPTVFFVAHNAEFEQAIWAEIMVKRYDFPEIAPERWICTMAKCAAMGLPLSLKMSSLALDLEHQKDLLKQKSMLFLSRPKADKFCSVPGVPEWWTPEEKPLEFEQLYEYNIGDVEVEYELDTLLPDLSERESSVYRLDQRINQYGVRADIRLLQSVMRLNDSDQEHRFLDFELATGISPTQRDKFKAWLAKRGLKTPNLQKETVASLVTRYPKFTKILTDYQACNHSSLAKFYKMHRGMDKDHIVRNLHGYHSAHTGRWGGRRVQGQNLMSSFVDMDTLCDILLTEDRWLLEQCYEDYVKATASSIRGAFVARPGRKLMVGDYSSIEAVLTAYLFGQDDKVQLFRDRIDTYCRLASLLFGHEVTKEDKPKRQVGKAGELGFGFEGGIAAGVKFGKDVDWQPLVKLILHKATSKEKESASWHYQIYAKNQVKMKKKPVGRDVGMTINIIKHRWRKAHPKIVRGWKEVQAAAIDAVLSGDVIECCDGKIQFYTQWMGDDDKGHTFLMCELPSGRLMSYPYPRVDTDKQGRHKLSYYHVNDKGKWIRVSTYGGKLTENVIQAMGRDLLVEAMFDIVEKFSERGIEIVMHVHDELVLEVPEDCDITLEDFLDVIRESGRFWAGDLPINATGFECYRYKKEV